MRIQLVTNPESGSYSPELIDRLRIEFENGGNQVVFGESSPRQALAVDPLAERLVVVGGDGTVRHVVAAIQASGREIPLIPYPAGTVNLMQREIRQTTDIENFVAHATSASVPRVHYSASINDTVFLTCASIGPDSESVANLSTGLKRVIGRVAYVIAFLSVLIRWPRHALTLTVDNNPINCQAFYLAKGRYFAGPWSFAPQARMDEQSLYLITIAELTRWIFLRFALAMLLGRAVTSISGIHSHRCRHVIVHSEIPLPIQGDGDIVSVSPANIQVARPYLVIRPLLPG